MKFGHFLKKEREAREWTQPQAAEAIGIEQSYLSKLENSKAIPSSDIFEALMQTYDFDLKKLGEAVDDSELEKLQEIVLIRDFIMRSRTKSEKARRHWLLAGLALVMVGVFFMGYSFSPFHDEQVRYTYESKGVLKSGESPFMFTEMPSFSLYKAILMFKGKGDCQTDAVKIMTTKDDAGKIVAENIVRDCDRKANILKSHPLFPRLDYKVNKTHQYVGEFYDTLVNKEVPDAGYRRYFLTETNQYRHTDPIVGMLALGLMLFIGGIASFFISRRW